MNVTEIKPIEAAGTQKIRLAIYCRVSSDSEDQLHSFTNQIRYYSTYVQGHPEYTLVDIYADEGITGTSMERRDEMNRMLADCKGGRIDRILTKSVSRFARNTEELLLSVRMLKEIGVSVYFEEQGIDTAKLIAEMILTMPGVVAQQESISISENMRWSYRKRMERGEFNCCKAAYGFRMIDGLLEIFEPEAKVVRWMFRLALRGIGRQSIANLLTAKNISTPSGGRIWSYTSVDQILRNPRYMGDAILQERYTTQTLPFKRKKNNGEMPKYYVENANPAIVTREVFEAVQILLEKRRGSSYAQRNRYPFSGILYCPDCGKTFRRQTTNGKAYWMCAARAAGKTNCRSIRFPEERLEETFTLNGKASVRLFVESDCEDTAFTAKIMEVTPEGKAYNIRSSIATLEQGKTEAGAYEPGSVAEVQITMWNIVYTIPKGSRIRVDVSSSDFPQYHVHSNQKGLWSEKTENKIAHQTIHMGGEAASCVILPLMKKQ